MAEHPKNDEFFPTLIWVSDGIGGGLVRINQKIKWCYSKPVW